MLRRPFRSRDSNPARDKVPPRPATAESNFPRAVFDTTRVPAACRWMNGTGKRVKVGWLSQAFYAP